MNGNWISVMKNTNNISIDCLDEQDKLKTFKFCNTGFLVVQIDTVKKFY